jgi:hypothetical protein
MDVVGGIAMTIGLKLVWHIIRGPLLPFPFVSKIKSRKLTQKLS